MPVRNAYDEIIAVAQVVNKNPGADREEDGSQDAGVFTAHDEHLFRTYLQFVGIAITNAQIVETSRQEYDRNRVNHKPFKPCPCVSEYLQIAQRAHFLFLL